MFNRRLRLLSSMLIAFLVVSFYGRFSTGPLISPTEASNIKNLLSNLKFRPSNLTKIFTISFNPSPSDLVPQNTSDAAQISYQNDYMLPAKPVFTNPNIIIPTDNTVPTVGLPCTGQTCLTPTSSFQPTIINQPTDIPKPTVTKYIKPTKVPPLPPITTATRPGTSLMAIFQDVSNRECIPAALLMAFKTEETGEKFKNDPASRIAIYNTYGWWQTGAGDPCYGEGYSAQSGIVPQDSIGGGTVCQNPIPSGADQFIMGIEQISQEEENAAKKYMTGIIKGNIDRRVLFDNAVIFAIITKNRLGTPPSNCNDWPSDAIKTAAEKHYGSCYISATRNYCNEILQLYKQYQ